MSEAYLDSSMGRRRLMQGGVLAVGVAAASAGLPTGTASAQASTGTSFFPIEPYRSFDSRDGAGPILSGQSGDLDLWVDRFGNPVIASSVQAVTYNLTVTNTAGRNFLSVFPAGVSAPNISSINWWTSGIVLANAAIVGLGFSVLSGPGSVTISCGTTGGRTDLIIDVTGYYDFESSPAASGAEKSTRKNEGIWRTAR